MVFPSSVGISNPSNHHVLSPRQQLEQRMLSLLSTPPPLIIILSI
jgi:hypothetical protein